MRVFHFLKAELALKALEKGRLKVARIDELNDPFELFAPDLRDPNVRKGFLAIKNCCAAMFGFLSFTRRWQYLMLWSMYADRHRGAVLEIELPNDKAILVRYRKSRLKLDVAKIMASGGFTFDHVDMIMATKSRHWKDEEEIRMAVSLKNDKPENELYFCEVDIRGIVIGALSELTYEQIREALPRGKSVKVARARLAFGSYDVVRRRDIPVKTITDSLP
jgi:hypothetical protein